MTLECLSVRKVHTTLTAKGQDNPVPYSGYFCRSIVIIVKKHPPLSLPRYTHTTERERSVITCEEKGRWDRFLFGDGDEFPLPPAVSRIAQ